MKKRKIVINNCFGGFSLSDEAFELYLQKKGIKYYKYTGRFYKISGSDYFTVPKEKYDRLAKKWYKEDGNYKRINEKNWYLSNMDIKRDDPVLVEVVEKLKDKANGHCAKLKIVEIPSEIDWEIEEYDGLEEVSEKHRSWR
jgi:hypothetical protein